MAWAVRRLIKIKLPRSDDGQMQSGVFHPFPYSTQIEKLANFPTVGKSVIRLVGSQQ